MEPILGLMQGLAWGKLNRRKFILYLNVFLPLKLKPVKTCDNIGVIEARCPHSTRPGRPQNTSSGCQGSTSPWRRCERLNTQTFGKFVPTHVFFPIKDHQVHVALRSSDPILMGLVGANGCKCTAMKPRGS